MVRTKSSKIVFALRLRKGVIINVIYILVKVASRFMWRN